MRWPWVLRSRLESVVDVNKKISDGHTARIADLESQNHIAVGKIAERDIRIAALEAQADKLKG